MKRHHKHAGWPLVMACRLGDAEGLCNCDVLCTTEVEVVFKVGSHKVYGGEGFLSSLAPCRKFCSSLQKKHLQIFICGYYSSFLCFIDVWRKLLSFFFQKKMAAKYTHNTSVAIWKSCLADLSNFSPSSTSNSPMMFAIIINSRAVACWEEPLIGTKNLFFYTNFLFHVVK